MRRQQGKIKDFVEAQTLDLVPDVAAEPARALAAYRFTDATSDLLARWLDALAEVPRHATQVSSTNTIASANMIRALAGARGVGKSHTLGAFAAIAAAPELRARLTDAHVATSARRLTGRRYVVAHVARGSAPTLIEEVAAGLARACGGGAEEYLAQANGDVGVLLIVAASRLYDATLVIVVDTAVGRPTRVAREDGKLLAELARAAHDAHAFIGLALDDDITNAEGVNVAIARAFRIDYLDPEHLFRIADIYVLRKNPNARLALHEFYLGLRAEVPGFNWSEPRFAALYPLHPLVADITSAVRLYAPSFALLPFAAEAAQRAAARPPLALVTLDDVFDRAETELRRSRALEKTFAAYTELCATSIGKLPVMARLEARLILKALFIVSLDGRGATAVEICAAMLFEDAAMGVTTTARARVAQALERFFADAPRGTLDRSNERDEPRYRLSIETTSGFDTQLKAAMQTIESGELGLQSTLHAAAQSRFGDWAFGTTTPDPSRDTDGDTRRDPSDTTAISDDALPIPETKTLEAATAYLTWRGTHREGLMLWRDESASVSNEDGFIKDGSISSCHVEWRVTVCAPPPGKHEQSSQQTSAQIAASPVNNLSNNLSNDSAAPVMLDVVWHPATPTNDERQILSRLIALQRAPELFATHGDTACAALATAHAHVERIWSRLYLDEGTLVINSHHATTTADHATTTGDEQKWSDEAKSASTLAEALSRTFAPFFDELYAQHPVFAELLDDLGVNRLVRDFFGGANAADADVQKLAAAFAAPLGLTVRRGATLTAATGDDLLRHAWARDIIQMSDAAEGALVPLAQVAGKLESSPFGFGQSIQRFVLAALVASRRLEFVTHDDDRISRRTLASSTKWEAIAGVARPAAIVQSAGELTAWARLLTSGVAGGEAAQEGESISDSATRESAREALAVWLAEWHAQKLLTRFAELPDEALTTRAADLASAVERSFEASAEAARAALSGDIPLEEGLQRVADAFVNSTDKFTKCQRQLAQLSSYVEHFQTREQAHLYLLAAEPTGVGDIDDTRRALLEITADPHALFDDHSQTRFEMLWREFHTAYIERFAARHDAVMNGAARRELSDELVRAVTFRELEALADLSLVDRRHWQAIERVRERVRTAHCAVDVRHILQTEPRCVCAFRLARERSFAGLTSELSSSIEIGRATARRTLGDAAPFVAYALEQFARSSTNSVAEHAARLSENFKHGGAPQSLSRREVQLIEQALTACASPPAVRVMLPIENHELLTPEELHARLTQWLRELPARVPVVEVTHRVD